MGKVKRKKLKKESVVKEEKQGFLKRYPVISIGLPVLATVTALCLIVTYSQRSTVNPNLQRGHLEQIATPADTNSGQNSLESRISFQEAKYNPDKRQEYVRNLTKSLAIPDYVQSIEYCTDTTIKGKDDIYKGRSPAMLTKNVDGKTSEIGAKRLSVRTRIFPSAFEMSENEKEFLAGVRHELNIAKIIYKGFDKFTMKGFYFTKDNKQIKFNNTLFHIAGELESYGKDIEYAAKEGLSQHRTTTLMNHYMRYYLLLWAENNPSPKSIMNRFKKLFFRGWMKNYDFYQTDEKGAYIVDQHRTYRLP